MNETLTIGQKSVLSFLTENKNNGSYIVKDIHENIFGRESARRRGFAFLKTSNILRALINKGLVSRNFNSDLCSYEYKLVQ